MSVWEQVKRMAAFELTKNVATPLLSIVYAGALLIVFISEQSFEQSIFIDIVFLALFSGGFTFFAKMDRFKPQMMNEEMNFSYKVMFLQHLPIANQAIIRSRIIVHNVYNIVIQLFFIIPLYIFSPAFHALMPVHTFIVFVVMWMSLGVFASGFTAADEAGKNISNRSFAKAIAQIALIGLALFTLYEFTSFSMIGGSVYIATHFPFLSCIGAIIIASSGIAFGQKKMKRTLQRTDYI